MRFSIAVIIAMTIFSGQGFAQTDEWLSIPSDKGAITMIVPGNVSNRTVVVRDDTGRLLDFAEAKAETPFLQQYRLAAGVYQLKLTGLAEVSVIVESGKMATIKISTEGVEIAGEPTEEVKLVHAELAKIGSDSGPKYINPADNILHFSAEEPGITPPSEKVEPDED
jgi:hypothetical protein